MTVSDGRVKLVDHPVNTLLDRVAWERIACLAVLKGMIHDGNATIALKSLPEGIDHQTAGFSFESELLVITHITRRNTIKVGKEDVRGTN